jgi:hypothetical protein
MWVAVAVLFGVVGMFALSQQSAGRMLADFFRCLVYQDLDQSSFA